MKLYETAKHKPGTYIGVKLTKQSIKKVRRFARENGVPDYLDADDIHLTLVYSQVVIPKAIDMIITTFNEPPLCTPLNTFDLWGDDKDILVMKVRSDYLTERHKFFMSQGGTHTFDSYEPHVTLSYKASGFSDNIKSLHWDDGDLEIESEYHKDLKLDWSDDL